MSATASARFYWSDWRSDPGLRLCSAATRGVWMDMLCIAADAEPTGYVLVNGNSPDARMLARLTGDTVEEVASALAELEQNGVFSRDVQGRIFCRRMVRDAKKAEVSRANGAHGGNPALVNKGKSTHQDNPHGESQDNLHRVQVQDKALTSASSESEKVERLRAREHLWPDDYEAQVWAAYPKRTEKKVSTSRLRAVHRADSLGWDVLMDGIRRLAGSLRDPCFAPTLDRWLRNEGWNDEYTPLGARGQPPPGSGQTIRNGAFAHAAKVQRELDERDYPNPPEPSTNASQPPSGQHRSAFDERSGAGSGNAPVGNLRLVSAYG